jgi:hypothetical protein
MIQTNIIDELGAVFTILGLLLVFFSEERHENREVNTPLRIKALVQSIWIVSFIWIGIFLLIYGFAIFFVSTTIFALFLLCCNIHFYAQLLIIRNKKWLSIETFPADISVTDIIEYLVYRNIFLPSRAIRVCGQL